MRCGTYNWCVVDWKVGGCEECGCCFQGFYLKTGLCDEGKWS